MGKKNSFTDRMCALSSRTPQRSCRAAHGAKHLPFCAAAIDRQVNTDSYMAH